jgi:hypothetical protein
MALNCAWKIYQRQSASSEGHLIRPAATFSPSDAEKELFCGTISRRRCLRTAHQRINAGLISVTPSAYLNSHSPTPPNICKIYFDTKSRKVFNITL